MKYSIVVLSAFLAVTTLALPAPAPTPMAKTGADLALHETGVGVTEGNDVVEKRTGATDPDTDSDTAGVSRPRIE
jgi:hypothetical protein